MLRRITSFTGFAVVAILVALGPSICEAQPGNLTPAELVAYQAAAQVQYDSYNLASDADLHLSYAENTKNNLESAIAMAVADGFPGALPDPGPAWSTFLDGYWANHTVSTQNTLLGDITMIIADNKQPGDPQRIVEYNNAKAYYDLAKPANQAKYDAALAIDQTFVDMMASFGMAYYMWLFGF